MALFSNVIGNKQLGRNNMMKWMREKRILKDNNTPYQQFVHHFKVITKPNPYNNKVNFTTLVRSSGVGYLVKKLLDDDKMKARSIEEILSKLDNIE
jgi:phage antirepressor YoqD-like protein